MRVISFFFISVFLFLSKSDAANRSQSISVTLEGFVLPSCVVTPQRAIIKNGNIEMDINERCNTRRELHLSTKKILLNNKKEKTADSLGNAKLSSPIIEENGSNYTLEVWSK